MTQKYKFKKIDFSYGTISPENRTYDYGVDFDSLDKSEKVLFEIASPSWNTKEIQMVIDSSNRLKDNEEFDYQIEYSNLYFLIKKKEVLIWGKDSKIPDITWTFEKFISFMESFKNFIELNTEY